MCPVTKPQFDKSHNDLSGTHTTNRGNIPSVAFPIQAPSDKPPFFVHCHVPKTGGTTFNSILENNFGPAYEPFQGRFIHLFPKVSCKQFEQFIEIQESIFAVSSHQFATVLPYRLTAKNVVSIAFIRDPVDQFFSKYFHQRRFGMKCPEHDFLIHDYINYKTKKNAFLNYSTYLPQMTPKAGLDYLEDLIKHENLFLFPLEQFDCALKILQLKFPNYFVDITYERKNISPKDQEVTQEIKEAVSKLIPQDNYIVHQLAMACLGQHLDEVKRDMTCAHI